MSDVIVDSPRYRSSFMLALTISFALPFQAKAATFGDITLTLEGQPRADSSQGYVELWVVVVNRSEATNHEIQLRTPRSSEFAMGDHIRAITRTFTVEAGKTVRVWLAYPVHQYMPDTGIAVAIDGKDLGDLDDLESLRGSGLSRMGRAGSYSRYSSSFGGNAAVLYSKSVDSHFIDNMSERLPRWIILDKADLMIPGGPGSQMVASGSSSRVVSSTYHRSSLALPSWSPNWLGYSQYNGVIVTADDLREMPAEVRSALGQYVECGGTLLILGGDAPLPGPWKPALILPLFSGCAAGFGRCFVSQQKDYSKIDPQALLVAMNSWQRNAEVWQNTKTPGMANKAFPISEKKIGTPVWGLLGIMLLFSILIGPVNIFILAQSRRRLWLFWTVPVFSFITCVLVLGYTLLSEQTSGNTRVEAFTVLDENSRRASTFGWFGVYTPMLGSGGLHFSTQTELTYQNDSNSDRDSHRSGRSGSALTIDWTRDQHLASGWQVPRAPSHFVIRKGESRRERMTISRGSDGHLEAVNGLGADITEFWYLDEKGVFYSAGSIPAGGSAILMPAKKPREPDQASALVNLYTREWFDITERLKNSGTEFLTPRTYLAFMDAAPFLDEPATKGSAKARTAVFGILREGKDGG